MGDTRFQGNAIRRREGAPSSHLGMIDEAAPEMETVNKKVCRDCGAEYSSGSQASTMHTKSQGHSGFKTVKTQRPKAAQKITYQPGYGPTGD